MTRQLKACVIGAGASGIAATKALFQAGIEVDCFEKTDRIGGLWVFREPGKDRFPKTAAYRSLHINTSRQRMEYSDFPMPADYPDFPSHAQIVAYFERYAEHFGFRRRIRFETEVARAARGDDGVWEVTLAGGEARRYDMLLVANGHHWDPQWPDPPFPGSFDGVEMHSHEYVDARPFAGKTVLVLGMGNSAMDIAVESSWHADRVLLAARRGAHIVPKYLFGKPLDQYGTTIFIPASVRLPLYRALLRFAVGRVEDYGLPKPDHRLGEAHPTISNDILSRVAHGKVTPRPNIARLLGDRVEFADGSIEKVDVIVYCTGYKVSFPFFQEDFLSAPDNDLPLFRRVFRPGIANLAFIGLLQPLGAVMPLSEAQGVWVADYLRGLYALRREDEMKRDMDEERAHMFARYVASRRHTMQVDFDDYLRALDEERTRGKERARQQGNRPPVPALSGDMALATAE